ncbi:uncharacterized protein LOC130051182 [Ostrea edulis]|uniref:uncharacterized protein LOC130051182 n=1 Tax=Ostrea edulis TaxID=37623 RepID=UPI0024AF2A02|nr:uncharacterized protein LOC130051182 [Ostrea edulis]
MLQVQHNYTGLQRSENQPEMTRGNDNDIPSSTVAISPHGTEISGYDVEEVEYEHFDRSTAYHVLSLRSNFHGSLLKSVELSSIIGHSSNNIGNEYDLISVSHDKELLPEKERTLSQKEDIRQSLIDETINVHIDNSQLMIEMIMKNDADKGLLKTTSEEISLPLRKTEALSPRACGLTEGLWSITGHSSEDESILSNVVINEKMDELCCSNHGKEDENRKRSNEANKETVDSAKPDEDDDLVVQNDKRHEEVNPQIYMYTEESGARLPPGRSGEYN